MRSKEIVISFPSGEHTLNVDFGSEGVRQELWNFYYSLIASRLQQYFDQGWSGQAGPENLVLREFKREFLASDGEEGNTPLHKFFTAITVGLANLRSSNWVEAKELRVTLYRKD